MIAVAADSCDDDPEDPVRQRQRAVRSLGCARFGLPSPEIDAMIRATKNLEELEILLSRVLQAASWDAVFGD